MIIQDEIDKAAIQYKAKQTVIEAVWFTVVFALICLQIFDYKSGWLWHVKSCLFILWLHYSGKEYKKRVTELYKTIDGIFKLRETNEQI